MPAALTYPGVYVEEVPSGVRTIVGVATSITAFIGRARRGPVNVATEITSFADFERIFGGLWLSSKMSFAVRDFYLNGGARAVIVRLFHPAFSSREEETKANAAASLVAEAAASKSNGKEAKEAATQKQSEVESDANKGTAEKKAAKTALAVVMRLQDTDNADAVKAMAAAAKAGTTRTINIGALRFRASSPGKWAGYLRVQVEAASGDGAKEAAERMRLAPADLFNLTVADMGPRGSSETFLNLTVKPSSRQIDRVLANESSLLLWAGDDLGTHAFALPNFSTVHGDDVTEALITLAEARRTNTDPTAQAIKDKAIELDNKLKAALASVSDGTDLELEDFLPTESEKKKLGLNALEQLYARDGLFNLLCIPPYKDGSEYVDVGVVAAASAYCEKRRAMLIVDPPKAWWSVEQARSGPSVDPDQIGTRSKNAAIFFPRIKQANPLRGNQLEEFAPCGVVAGVFARTDTQRGVWKSPAGLDASLVGVDSLQVPMTDEENGLLNPLGINCLRTFPVFGRVIWGARTMRGADAFADEYKYIPVRRTALFIEESLYRGLKWVVFEPNDEPLWAQIRLNVGAFMHNMFRQGAFQGTSSREAYFVRCDRTTTTQTDINLGIVNVHVGFAPLKPAEFVVIKLQQMAGQIEA